MIRSTKHYYQQFNAGKRETIRSFLDAYRQATQSFIDYIWDTVFKNKEGKVIFDRANEILDFLPSFLDYQCIELKTPLSARALSAAITQAIGIVKGSIAIRRKLLYIIRKRKEDNLSSIKWENKLAKNKIRKPLLQEESFAAELSSKNIEIKESQGYFDFFIRLGSTGFTNLHLPIKYHKQDKKWLKQQGKLLNGILIGPNYLQLRYQLPDPPKKTEGSVVGGDTGYKTTLTLSNTDAAPNQDIHGHSLQSICQTLSRRQKGSKGFQRTQDHRKNFINWSVKQLNLSNIKEIKLEAIDNIFYGRRTSKELSRWTNTVIQSQILKLAEEQGVLVSLQPSTYKSQRCSGCGLVRKSNRKGKTYTCKQCGLVIDADLNSAHNQVLGLPAIPFWLRHLNINREGFFWQRNGFFQLDGQEIRVPDAEQSRVLSSKMMDFD